MLALKFFIILLTDMKKRLFTYPINPCTYKKKSLLSYDNVSFTICLTNFTYPMHFVLHQRHLMCNRFEVQIIV